MNFFRSIRRPRWVILSLALLVSAVFVYAVAAQEPQEPVVGPSGLPSGEGPKMPAVADPVIGPADVPLGGINEPAIAVNPLNANNIVMADLLLLRVSTDNGASFSAFTVAVVPAGFGLGGDPSLAFDSQGRLFWTYLGRRNDNGNLDVFISQVNPATGAIVAGPFNVTASAGLPASVTANNNDKEWLAADRFPGSPFQDRLYVVWTRFTPTGVDVHAAFSTDQGVTWTLSTTNPLSAAGENFVWPPHNAVAPNGDVYVAYHSQPIFAAGAPNGTSGQIFVLRSTDGGATYPQKNTAYTAGNADISFNVQGLARMLNQNQSWTQGSAQPWILPDPLKPGNVYVVAADDPTNAAHGGANDDMAVFIVRSTNSGVSWGAPVQIDSGPGSSHQFFPTAAIDYTSQCLSVTWYDSRNGAKNANGNFLLDVFIRSSPDGGLTFGPEVQLNAAPFDPDLGAIDRFPPTETLRIGEYNGVAVVNGTAHAVWTGNRLGSQQIFYDSAIACFGPDDDNDGLPNTYENAHACLDPLVDDAAADPDNDGLSNLDEFGLSTDPCDPHSDEDTMPDGYEAAHPCLDPLADDGAADTDGDTLSNLTEFGLGTDPCEVDTDQDGCSDGEEVAPKSEAAFGGGRNPLYFWDFFDPTGNGAVGFTDFLALVARNHAVGDPTIDPLSDPPPPPAYHPRFDRGGQIPGENLWEELPANGSIGFGDFLSLIRQNRATCVLPP